MCAKEIEDCRDICIQKQYNNTENVLSTTEEELDIGKRMRWTCSSRGTEQGKDDLDPKAMTDEMLGYTIAEEASCGAPAMWWLKDIVNEIWERDTTNKYDMDEYEKGFDRWLFEYFIRKEDVEKEKQQAVEKAMGPEFVEGLARWLYLAQNPGQKAWEEVVERGLIDFASKGYWREQAQSAIKAARWPKAKEPVMHLSQCPKCGKTFRVQEGKDASEHCR